MFNDANPLDRRAEDRAASDDEDDTAIALTLDTLDTLIRTTGFLARLLNSSLMRRTVRVRTSPRPPS